MAVERAERHSRPLLPDELEQRIGDWFKRVAGGLLLALSVGAWASIATWSAQDPSLTHATGMPVRNWLGPGGAIASDVLLQTLGFSAVLALLATTVIGFELAASGRIRCFKLRLGLFPSAVLALAAALSSMPAPESWPLSHGLGGIGGDIMLGLVSNLTAFVAPSRPAFVAGILMFGLGMCLLSAALGLDQSDWTRILTLHSSGGALTRALQLPVAAVLAATAGSRERPQTGRSAQTPDWPALDAADAAAPKAGRSAGSDTDRDSAMRVAADEDVALPRFLKSLTDRARGLAPQLSGLGTFKPTRGSDTADASEPPPEDSSQRPLSHAAFERPQTPNAIRHAHPASARASLHEEPDERPEDEPDSESALMANRLATSAHRAEATRSASSGRGFRIFKPHGAEAVWQRPSLNLLRRPGMAHHAKADVAAPVLRGTARLIEDALNAYGIPAHVRPLKSGPLVTSFEIEPARNVSHERTVDLADEIARAVGVTSVRIVSETRKSILSVELPNVNRETVWLRDVLETEAWRRNESPLPIVLGVSAAGATLTGDLDELHSLLISGAPGSGRSTLLNALMTSLVYARGPADCRFIVIDPGLRELPAWTSSPHLLAPPATDQDSALALLNWAAAEIDERYKRMTKLGVRSLDIYNNRIRNARRRGEILMRTVQTGFDPATDQPTFEREEMELRTLPHVVVVIAELAELMAAAGADTERALAQLAARGRSAGLHVVASTSRPAADIITGTVKGAFAATITLKLATKADSRRIIGEPGAERLLGQGDMVWMAPDRTAIRAHGPFLEPDDVDRVIEWTRGQSAAVYDPNLVAIMEHGTKAHTPEKPAAKPIDSEKPDASDELLDRAIAIVHREGRVSVSTLQRRLAISMSGAANLIARLEKEGLISRPDESGRRHVLNNPRL